MGIFILCPVKSSLYIFLSPIMTAQKCVSFCNISELNLLCSALGVRSNELHSSPTATCSPWDSLIVLEY